jgi:hypothetical protein
VVMRWYADCWATIGVIPPPPVGDEGIYTKVPNPEAGHEKEVIPPPGSPGGDPNVEPR